MSEHTGSEWRVAVTNELTAGPMILDEANRKIAWVKGNGRKNKEVQANARLIAAAPGLLAAAEKVISENVDKEIEGLPGLIEATNKAKGVDNNE